MRMYLLVPLNDDLIVPASPPGIDHLMVTKRKTVTLRHLFSQNATEQQIVGATLDFVNGATIVIDEVPDSLKYLEFEPFPMTPMRRQVAESSLETWRKMIYGDKAPQIDVGDA